MNKKNIDQDVVDFLSKVIEASDENFKAYYTKVLADYQSYGNMFQKRQEDVLRNAKIKKIVVPAAFSQIDFPASDKGVDETRGTLPVLPPAKWAPSALAAAPTVEQQIAHHFAELARLFGGL